MFRPPSSQSFPLCRRTGGGCGTGVYGFRVALTVEANTHYCEPRGRAPLVQLGDASDVWTQAGW